MSNIQDGVSRRDLLDDKTDGPGRPGLSPLESDARKVRRKGEKIFLHKRQVANCPWDKDILWLCGYIICHALRIFQQ